jgi:hypothetical protein
VKKPFFPAIAIKFCATGIIRVRFFSKGFDVAVGIKSSETIDLYTKGYKSNYYGATDGPA